MKSPCFRLFRAADRCTSLAMSMHIELEISRHPIDEQRLSSGRHLRGQMGAVVTFLGVVRGWEDGKAIAGLDYEAFEPMARHQFMKIFEAAGGRWPIASIRLYHRIGPVLVDETSLWVEVITPHRAEAFAACQYLIEEMKRLVPIWKRTMLPQ